MKKGDKVYAAQMWMGRVEIGEAEILRVTPKLVQIAAEGRHHGGSAFRYRSLIPHSDVYLSRAVALGALLNKVSARVGGAREALRSAESDFATVAAALREVQP